MRLPTDLHPLPLSPIAICPCSPLPALLSEPSGRPRDGAAAVSLQVVPAARVLAVPLARLGSPCSLRSPLSQLLLGNLQKHKSSPGCLTLSKLVLKISQYFQKCSRYKKSNCTIPISLEKTHLKSRNIIRTFPFEGKRSKSLHRFQAKKPKPNPNTKRKQLKISK